MKICIFGAGAVGGHMAVRLAHGGGALSVVMRGANLETARRDGLELRCNDGQTLRAKVPATDRPADLGPQDVVVFSVKYRGLAAALEAAAPLIGAKTQVITAMNGMPWWFAHGLPFETDPALRDLLDPGRAFSQTVPTERWTACVVTSGNAVAAPGVITNTTPVNKLRLGSSAGPVAPNIERFAEIARAGGYDAQPAKDIRTEIWSKLLINAGVSSVATICEQTTAEICREPRTRAISIGVIDEIIALGRQLNISVAADAATITDPATMPAHVTSFLQDLKAGRPLEIENGILALSAMAAASGTNSVHLQTVAAVMLARSKGSAIA